jgi:hypothetical protein
VVSEVKGRKIYVQTTASGPIGVDAAMGTLLWRYPIDQTTAVIPTPIVRGDLVFFSAGYRRGGALLRQVPQADGGVTIEEIYGLNTDLANKHGGIVLVGDHLYGDDAEGATDASHASDLGFMRQADIFEPILRTALESRQ